jgi:hypothetical protein
MSTMAHMLARLRGSRLEDVKSVLHADAPKHAEQGLHLEHLFIERVHKETLKQDPTVNLPLMTYLEEDMDRKSRNKLERTKI